MREEWLAKKSTENSKLSEGNTYPNNVYRFDNKIIYYVLITDNLAKLQLFYVGSNTFL
jgi:hypothetical protein